MNDLRKRLECYLRWEASINARVMQALSPAEWGDKFMDGFLYAKHQADWSEWGIRELGRSPQAFERVEAVLIREGVVRKYGEGGTAFYG